ncbi:hypothetical protein HG536_0H01560 [Torulaspora globosa]|uniref:Ketopantoate reductase C-terminal domain-containing protein n=1 Tax=Torulaspora globosa TaxID=48254 RepID=A0A7G3ZMP5_9SACH|nr:uncharacterized protein HG536_0H01560 [Torulaspora globosa]QLL34781.1 hypothetical protein HG536_0H01560 [Torulaspora globosa]
MGSSSMLRVLIVGNNPNLVLYASRFQLAKSVELFHVSSTKSNIFSIETVAYGKEEFKLDNHFTSVSNLIEALKQSGDSASLIFDMIILSASSLQEVSSSASQINPLININTKLFLESSGFVQLEPFVKMSLDLPQLNIFSIATDYDIRQVGDNLYQQFGGPRNGGSAIFLGESSVIGQQQQQQQNSKNSPANSSSSLSQTATKYPKNVVTLLETFQRLFKKLLPQDTIGLCNYSAAEFVSQQWALAVPKICFDPLLILFEETKPKELHQHILAKPLISGLVTEVITVMKSMGAKLNGNMENESSLLSHWQRMYPKPDEMPSLVYHYIRRTASLNIDMLLLQPILLADDYGIKTPYLEFLYSAMCQYQKLNEGKSKWFARVENQQDLKSQLVRRTEEKNLFESKAASYESALQEKDALIQQLQSSEQSFKSQVSALQNQIGALRKEMIGLTKKHEMELQQLREEQRIAMANTPHANSNTSAAKEQQETAARDHYGPTGTPNLKDIEDVALFGINYGDTPRKDEARQHLQQPTPPPTSGSMHSSGSHSGSGSGSGSEVDKSLKERELEIRKKELDLQERELELQRRAVQQQHQRFSKSQKQNNNPTSPTLGNRKSSFPHLQQASGVRPNRSMHGAAPAQALSAGNFVDPLSSSMGYRGGGTFNQTSLIATGQMQSHHSHSIKPTSRKNRNSNMAIIGNASSLGLNDYGRPPPAPNQTRLNSLSTGNLNSQPRLRQQSNVELNNIGQSAYNASTNLNAKLNMPHPIKASSSAAVNQPMSGGSTQQPLEFQTKRQFSSSTTAENNTTAANMSMSSVVHNPMTETIDQRQTQASAQVQSPPQINIDGPESPLPSSGGMHMSDSNEEIENSTGDSSQPHTDAKKDKKKKFGLFGKKNKSKNPK